MNVTRLPDWVETVETDERVEGIRVDLSTRFRSRAERRRRRLNERRILPFYRWEVVREDGRWQVVAFQNQGRSKR